ncbi:methyltransferase domain-containing protein [Patescibacteria group bacterium]|nr:methyltransferase domain-containing protein [Patescibacteria group bacterium]
MRKNKRSIEAPWDRFFREKIIRIFSEKKTVIDIGGGLRVSKKKGNRYDPGREWILPYIEKVDYKVMDPVDTYHPDIVGDIQALPMPANSVDAIICLAVLEHVEDPITAWKEMYRVLKPGGFCLIYVPFLYYYHAEKGYYGDFWRFTKDGIAHLSRQYTSVEIEPVRGAIETWIRLSPLGRVSVFNRFARVLDRVSGKLKSDQVSGYNVFLIK